MLYILTHWLSNDKKYRTNECKKKSKFVEQKKPSDKCLDCRSGKKKNDRIKHSTICLRLVIWLLLIFLLNVYIYTNINNKKREKKKTSCILTCVCEAVFNRWCVKLMMRNVHALNMPFSFFPFFLFYWVTVSNRLVAQVYNR